MNFVYLDHRNPQGNTSIIDFSKCLDEFAALISLQKFIDWNKNCTQPVVLFAHCGDQEPYRLTDVLGLIRGNNCSWVIFVSSDITILRKLGGNQVKKITVPLPQTVIRLKALEEGARNELIRRFKNSCGNATGPDMMLLEGVTRWPEHVLSWYLCELAKDKNVDCSAHLDMNAVVQEFNEYASFCDVAATNSQDALKKAQVEEILRKVSGNVR